MNFHGFFALFYKELLRFNKVALQTLGVFNLLLLAACAWFAFRGSKSAVRSSQSPVASG